MSFVQAFFLTLLPHLTEVASAVIAILLAGLFRILKTRWGIEIEARHREALQSAMMTGITAALSRGLKADAAIAAAIQHAAGAGARDAVEFFNLGVDDLKRLAEAKLHSAIPLFGIDIAGQPDETVATEVRR
ncbi:hypothetical protein M3484_04950 [Pseudomonas sp. GX19020]|uniref:hypothetical protein n=1 Tax=Pseudomonas sp. GX19020 TaxID=2942277 RepID=UPI0020188D46|nr:hypothetical protein [Pseudomonas sp. GX19020]MCL4065909.1 hypothetical protein [Pseudomonas sp. GX19020]